MASGVRRIFETAGKKFENNENQKKISPLRISPFFCPKLGEDQQKKKVFSQILSVFVLRLSAPVTKRAMPQFYMLFYANYTILGTQGTMPGLNTPLGMAIQCKLIT